MSTPLDPLQLPLHGSLLVEASAGTGKTWTIAALYLRLVLGHGGAGALPPLWPDQILVMTFTKAATRELSDRIRQRLVDAAACFRGDRAPAPNDGFLTALLAQHAGDAREHAAWRLAMAAEAMDDAAVHTIDAWCQRMLREHAFDSGSLFDEELQANEAALQIEAAHDHWRQQVYPLDDEALAFVQAQWRDVQALLQNVKPLLDKPLPAGAGDGSLHDRITQARAAQARALATLKAGWPAHIAEMRDWLEVQFALKDGPFNKAKFKPANCRGWLAQLDAWAADAELVEPALTTTARQRLTPDGLLAVLKPDAQIDAPPCFAALEALWPALARLPNPQAELRAHAAARIQQRLQQLKQQAGRFGFADMLNRLDDALDTARHGERAERLRARIVAQYPAALIDEFQDTSPVQLRIFDRLYRIAADDPQRALLLIGDPKQAIYGFRGADIYSYLQARRATAGRHHVLGTNHRSTQALVAVVNAAFTQAEQRAGEGAFLFRTAAADELPFEPVQAAGRAERWVRSGGVQAALTICLDPELRSAPTSRALMAERCAERIVQTLNDAGAGFVGRDGTLQALRPADIAVLVRTGLEAGAVRTALRQRGLASVYLSDKDSVFASAEAPELLRLLQAVAAPRDLRLVRAALASALLGLSLDDLLLLAQDDAAFDARHALMLQLQQVWQQQGVLAMLRRALHALGLPARWLAASNVEGERRLTNVLHLAELLQAASGQLDGDEALVRWFAQQIDDARGGQAGGDEQVLRLESDADLVQVVTVHKSKGLEYPLVFLPFVADFREGDALWLPDGQGGRELVLSPSAAQVEQADRERLREDLRLLYVALTRARHALWLGLAPLKHGRGDACLWHRSAIGYLLSGPDAVDADTVLRDVQAWASAQADVQLDIVDAEPGRTRLRPRGDTRALRPVPVYEARFDRSWAIGSYSALVKDIASGPPPLRVLRDDEPAEVPGPLTLRRGVDAQPWHRFPRGAFAGNFLHDQLEWLAGETFALDASDALQDALRRRCTRQGWEHRADDVVAWLRRVCATPLPALRASLAELPHSMAEMEFWLPSDGLRATVVDALCREHILPGQARPELPERTLHGMLMGFADLVYEHEGRWGVLDYKSNALGAHDSDYHANSMAAAMLEHRYDVQAALYLLALHRLLKLRLGAAYAPGRHLHGAIYFFLRGVGSASAGCFHIAPPVALIEALDAMLGATA